jgi:hypothetical protein
MLMNMHIREFSNLNKTKTIALSTLNFGSKSVLLLLTCMQSIYAINKTVSEKTCLLALRSPEKLLKSI